MAGKIFIATELDVNAAALRAAAARDLLAGGPMPAQVKAIRTAQAVQLRDKRTVGRGMTDAALDFFWALTAGGRPASVDLEALVFDIAITPEHRRMFPELPETDGVSVWKEGGRVKFEFFDVEWRKHG